MKSGFARAEITTREGNIHDPLYVKALVLDDGATRAALVSLDTICLGGGIGDLDDAFFPALRRSLVPLGVTFLLGGATHTHTPGRMLRPQDEVLAAAADAVRQAIDTLEPARVGSGIGHDPSFAVNRTLKLSSGSAWTIRQAHPLPPDREIAALDAFDDTVGVLRVDRADGSPLCTLFTFGCHPLLGYASNAVTANYPGVAERLLRQKTGADAIFFQSCGGDVTEIAYKDYDRPKCCEEPGISLGLAALDVWRGIETRDVVLRAARRGVTFPRRADIPDYRGKLLAECDALVASLADCPLDFRTFLPLYMKYLVSPDYPLAHKYAYLREEERGLTQLRDQDTINRKNLEKYIQNVETMEKLSKIASTLDTLSWHEDYNRAAGADTVDGEVTALGIGDCALLSVPVELLSEVGQRIRAASPIPKTFIAAYANGYMHYGAPAASYQNGGYETIECFLGAGWQETAERAAAEVLDEIEPKEETL
ncbi:MAG: hypothetical protein VB111_09910 [Clostridiaceae bacterium]|nr:hypothetical protein [Clostridiaceae bacterium]